MGKNPLAFLFVPQKEHESQQVWREVLWSWEVYLPLWVTSMLKKYHQMFGLKLHGEHCLRISIEIHCTLYYFSSFELCRKRLRRKWLWKWRETKPNGVLFPIVIGWLWGLKIREDIFLFLSFYSSKDGWVNKQGDVWMVQFSNGSKKPFLNNTLTI